MKTADRNDLIHYRHIRNATEIQALPAEPGSRADPSRKTPKSNGIITLTPLYSSISSFNFQTPSSFPFLSS